MLLRRTLLTLFGLQVTLAVIMSVVDSYRRRGKKPHAFPTTPPGRVEIGDSTVTTYTFGRDLYDDMIAAAEHLVASGRTRPKRLVISGASNGVALTLGV